MNNINRYFSNNKNNKNNKNNNYYHVFFFSGNMLDELERIYRRAGSRKLWSDILTHKHTQLPVELQSYSAQTNLDPRSRVCHDAFGIIEKLFDTA